MGHVDLEKIVKHVQAIVLERIHVIIALLQTGKHPLGWNVVHHVEILLHGLQNMVKVVVALYKISQCLLHIIMVLTFHHVHVRLLVPIVAMVHVMEAKRVELVLVIVGHVHLRLEQVQGHHPIHLHKHLLALHPILQHKHQLARHPIHLLKHPLELGLHQILHLAHHPILEHELLLVHQPHQPRQL